MAGTYQANLQLYQGSLGKTTAVINLEVVKEEGEVDVADE